MPASALAAETTSAQEVGGKNHAFSFEVVILAFDKGGLVWWKFFLAWHKLRIELQLSLQLTYQTITK